jgi:hypothetical protein
MKKTKKSDYYKEREKKRRREDAALHSSIARKEELNAKLLKDSGSVVTSSRTASFLYEAMRDGHISPGAVASLLANSPPGKTRLTNGFLGKYAIWAAKELMQ